MLDMRATTFCVAEVGDSSVIPDFEESALRVATLLDSGSSEDLGEARSPYSSGRWTPNTDP